MSGDRSESNGSQPSSAAVRQLRVVVRAADFDQAVTFYRDTLGLHEVLAFDGDHGARVMILDGGRATFELANAAHVDLIDDIEVGRRVSPDIRIAFEVDNAEAATRRLANVGATIIAEPTETPWRSLNSRLEAPDGLQLTLFQELDPQR